MGLSSASILVRKYKALEVRSGGIRLGKEEEEGDGLLLEDGEGGSVPYLCFLG